MSVLAACMIAAGCAAGEPDPPATVAENLYTILRDERVSGAPTAEQLKRLAPLLSDTLHALLASAERMRQDDILRHPGAKPSFAEGDLFSSLFEGPSNFRVLDEQPGSPHRVNMILTYNWEGASTSWSDHVVLIQEDGRWVVDDVEYGGQWDFAAQGSLRSSLELVLRIRQ